VVCVMKGWTAETKSAIEAVTFIAAHLKNEDDYAEVIFVTIVATNLTALARYNLSKKQNQIQQL